MDKTTLIVLGVFAALIVLTFILKAVRARQEKLLLSTGKCLSRQISSPSGYSANDIMLTFFVASRK